MLCFLQIYIYIKKGSKGSRFRFKRRDFNFENAFELEVVKSKTPTMTSKTLDFISFC